MKGSVVKVVGYRKLRAVPCRAAVIPLEDIEAVVDVALVIDIARVPGVRDVDGLPVCVVKGRVPSVVDLALAEPPAADRKSTRLNSSHVAISYAVFCLKKKTYTANIA